MDYPCERGRWVYQENTGLWGMGAWKMTKKSVIRVCCCIPLRLVFTLQDRTSGDLDLVGLEALWKGTGSIVQLYRENSGYREKWIQTLGARAGGWCRGFVCQRQPPNFGQPWPSCGCLWWNTLASQVGRYIGKTLVYAEWGLKNDEKSVILATTHMVLYPDPACIHIEGSNFG